MKHSSFFVFVWFRSTLFSFSESALSFVGPTSHIANTGRECTCTLELGRCFNVAKIFSPFRYFSVAHRSGGGP